MNALSNCVFLVLAVAMTLRSVVIEARAGEEGFSHMVESFADLGILRYQVPDFDKLTLKQKKLAYYLSQAGYAGRDIAWDQNYKHNLSIRRTLEEIVKNYEGDRSSNEFKKFTEYTKRVWFSNGIHHHYSGDKFLPEFCESFFLRLIENTPRGNFPLLPGENSLELAKRLIPIMYKNSIDGKKVCLDSTLDMIAKSAVNFYDNLSKNEVDQYYEQQLVRGDSEPISYGLNSKKVRQNGELKEIPYKIGGLYGEALTKVVKWLKKAQTVAENEIQAESIAKLIEYYETGDLKKFDEYNKLWVKDTTSRVDFIHGFIETYNDPIGKTGSYESVVTIRDQEASEKYGVLSREAQWFENHSPIMKEHKKEKVKGISYNVINVVSESGDSSPSTPIGINLPNSSWLRENYGSKSISLANIEHAYNQLASSGHLQEFYLPEQQEFIEKYGEIAGKLHTGLHEVVGHASGKLENSNIREDELQNYDSTLEEARADLVALYFMGDQHLVDIGVSPTTEIYKASYSSEITNGLLSQLSRIELGKDLEEAHMRDRQLIAKWVLERSNKEALNVIERKDIVNANGEVSTYFVINDFNKLRGYFGELLREIQRIKSQGDYEAGKALVENYGVKIDQDLHKQVIRRYKKLKSTPYKGFINPVIKPIKDSEGNIIDVRLDYTQSFEEQMLHYAKKYSFLPSYP